MKTIQLLLFFITNVILTLTGSVYKVVIDNSLNINKNTTISSPVVGTLYNGQYIYATNVSNGWVEFYKGYCNIEYLVKETNGDDYKTKVSLNFRKGPGISYDVLTVLTGNTDIIYFGRDPFVDGWAVTDKGYCLMNYIVPNNTTFSNDEPPIVESGEIKLITAHLKQYNYPYEYAAGCTIKKYGSCITSVTMAINQIQKRNFTPYNIAKRMIFNNCGAFFSSFTSLGFTVIHNPTLEVILESLKAGHIVPYGSKNSMGAQHWVAIYGYIGDYKDIQSSDFLIYDPGYVRSKLSEHMNIFPISYIVFIYN